LSPCTLAKRDYTARLARASGYFYFHFGEAADWLDRTVQVERISDKTVDGSPSSSGCGR
jgi:hypothetical protein